ncbi:MAG: radical SAM protein [Desulfocapsaceae bacterium]|nr:radical SAM protein [Desulfocapsaceae bacterium]
MMLRQFFRNIRTLSNNHIPAQLVIQMTSHCNARCPQCGMRSTAEIPRRRLASDEIKHILDAAAERGVQAVSFTGGEPLLFQDELISLIEYASRAGIPFIRTGTNGFLFRHADHKDFSDRVKKLADRLAATPLRNFWISLDSAVPEVHERMRGFPGVVRGIEKALPLFHAAGLFPSANMGLNRMVGGEATAALDPQSFSSDQEYLAVFSQRYREALDCFYHLVRNLGFTMVNTCYPMSISCEEMETGLHPVYAATTTDAVVRFSAAEKAALYKALLDTIPKHRHHLRIFSPLSSIYSLHRRHLNSHPDETFGCRGGIDFFYIDADGGDTYPCGYRGNENMGKFWQLDFSARKTDHDCRLCDWECFRDPSELCAPLLNMFKNPLRLILQMRRHTIYRRLWLEDIRYFRACSFFNARIKPDYAQLYRFQGQGELPGAR